ncbi:OprD family porin [Pseudomonas sp. BN417]|nr:OprD family porin [Pseudomonas sp. BN417]
MKLSSHSERMPVSAVSPAIALAIACAIGASSVAAAQQESGFIEDATGTLTLRIFYLNRNFVDTTRQGRAEEWTQSFILDAKPGFTQGSVGFGVDALGLLSVKLDGGKGTKGTQLLVP